VFASLTEEDASKVKRWMAQRKRTFPAATVAPKTAFVSYGIDKFPQLVMIDRKGIVVHHWAGMRSEESLHQEIEELLIQ
jgi:glutathione peroxidase-family protein